MRNEIETWKAVKRNALWKYFLHGKIGNFVYYLNCFAPFRPLNKKYEIFRQIRMGIRILCQKLHVIDNPRVCAPSALSLCPLSFTMIATKSTQILQSVHKVMRMHGMQDTLAYSLQSSVIHSRQLLQLRAHTLMCFVGLFPLIKFPQTHSRTRQCNLQVLASRVYGNATCKFELPKLGKIYKLSKFVLRGY